MLPRAAFAWNEPDSFSGIKFWHPINESLAECPLENRKDVLGPALADTLAATTEKMKQSRASAEKLLALHEEEKKRIRNYIARV
jgi:hypothetical protein